MEEKQKKWNISRRQGILLIVNVVFILAYIGIAIAAEQSADKLYSQKMARRWEEEKNSYAEVSAFLSPGENRQPEDINNVRSSIQETLSKDSIAENDTGGRVFIDAYYGECTTQLRKDTNTLSVTAAGIGGDFFLFHPMPLLSGGYISEGDLNQDRIVVDENFAWAMFGSNDVVGMQVWLKDTIFTIAGVVAVEEDDLYQTAYGTGNRVYIPYGQLKQQQEDLRITCYELVMPNSIPNYACQALQAAFGLGNEEEDSVKQKESPLNFGSIEIIENSNRYDFMQLLTVVKNRKYQVMRTNAVGYPFWENLARVEEQKQIRLLLVRMLLLLLPVICLIAWIYDLWQKRTWTVKGLCEKQADRIRRFLEERAEEKRREREEIVEASEEEEPETLDLEKEQVDSEELKPVTEDDIFKI